MAEHRGAEIKTEGDSFYVAVDSPSAAVRCGLRILELAAASRAAATGAIFDGAKRYGKAVRDDRDMDALLGWWEDIGRFRRSVTGQRQIPRRRFIADTMAASASSTEPEPSMISKRPGSAAARSR